MPNYRLPGGLAQITVNGRTYRADAAGLVTATGVDAAAIAGAGGLVDGGAGSAPEWSLAADGTADGLIGPDGTKATGNTAIAAAALAGGVRPNVSHAGTSMSKMVAVTYFVDSVRGGASNNGSSPESAFAALSQVPTLGTLGCISLARGSSFRESITTAASGAVVTAHGSGPLPVIRCDDIASNAAFSKTAGRTSVYEIAWTHSTVDKLRVWVDGTALTRAASLAACDSTAGTFYTGTPSSPTTVYVHPSGDTSPLTDGKVYEITKRGAAITGFAQAFYIRTKRNGSDNGSASLVDGGYAYRCIFEDGIKHNAIILGGGKFEECIFNGGENLSGYGSSTLSVFYADDMRGKVCAVKKCVFIGDGTASNGKSGTYCHSVSDAYAPDQLTVEDSAFYGLNVTLDGKANRIISRRNYHGNFEYAIAASPLYEFVSENEWVDGGKTGVLTSSRAIVLTPIANNALVTITGLRAAMRSSNGAAIWINSTGSGMVTTVTNSIVDFVNKTGFPYIPLRVDVGSLTSNKNLFLNASTHLQTASGVTYTANNNDFYPSTVGAAYDGGTQADVAAFKTATSQDAASITTDPGLFDAINGAFGMPYTAGARAIGAGLTDNGIEYTTVPSAAQIAAL